MKSLHTLIRLGQRALDEKRRALNVLQDAADRLNERRAALAREHAREAEHAAASADGGYGYGDYLAGARRRDAALLRDLQALSDRIEAARAEIAEAFAEIKRLELIEAAQAERARKQAEKREQDEANELGLNIYRRNSRGSA
jgi:flagellar export protein FliJ